MFEQRDPRFGEQDEFWLPKTALPRATAGPFYSRLNDTLDQIGFAASLREPSVADASWLRRLHDGGLRRPKTPFQAETRLDFPEAGPYLLEVTGRLVSLILLICFGVLIPMQSVPQRLCLLENRILSSALGVFASCEEDVSKCCQQCGGRESGEHGRDCCVDLEHLPEFTIPVIKEALPLLAEWPVTLPPSAFQLVSGAIESENESAPAGLTETVPIPGPARQAMLRVWMI